MSQDRFGRRDRFGRACATPLVDGTMTLVQERRWGRRFLRWRCLDCDVISEYYRNERDAFASMKNRELEHRCPRRQVLGLSGEL